MHRELDAKFATISERGFKTSVANIARVTAILERSNDPNVRQALRYAQRAWIQLDQQNPASTLREEHVGESRSQARCGRTNLNYTGSSTLVLPGGLTRTSNGIILLVCRVTSR
jgi:hypothetical protein